MVVVVVVPVFVRARFLPPNVLLSTCNDADAGGGGGAQEIPELKGIPSFWVDTADRIDVRGNKVLHKLAHGELKVGGEGP